MKLDLYTLYVGHVTTFVLMTTILLLIGLSLLVPTLTIGFWPRIAIDFYQAGTDALSQELSQVTVQAIAQLPFIG